MLPLSDINFATSRGGSHRMLMISLALLLISATTASTDGVSSTATIVALLNGDQPESVHEGLKQAARSKDLILAPHIVNMLFSQHHSLHAKALKTLHSIFDGRKEGQIFEDLRRKTLHPSDTIRLWAIRGLDAVKDPDNFRFLSRLADDPQNRIQRAVSEILNRNASHHQAAIIHALSHPGYSSTAKKIFITALGASRLTTKLEGPPLDILLESLSSPSDEIAKAAAEALANSNNDVVISPLIKRFKSLPSATDLTIKTSSEETSSEGTFAEVPKSLLLRATICLTLGKIWNRSAVRFLRETVNAQSEAPIVRQYAALSLMRIRWPWESKEVAQLMNAPDTILSLLASEAIGRILEKDSAPILVRTLTTQLKVARVAADKALRSLKGDAVKDLLLGLLSPDPELRMKSQQILNTTHKNQKIKNATENTGDPFSPHIKKTSPIIQIFPSRAKKAERAHSNHKL